MATKDLSVDQNEESLRATSQDNALRKTGAYRP